MKPKLIKHLPTLPQNSSSKLFSPLWTLKLKFNNLFPLSWINYKKTKYVLVKQFPSKFQILAIGTLFEKNFFHLKKNIFWNGKKLKTLMCFLLFPFSYSIYKTFLKWDFSVTMSAVIFYANQINKLNKFACI